MGFSEQERNEAVEEIFNRITDGESLRKILIQNRSGKVRLPKWTTFFEWLDSSEKWANQYARACDLRQEFYIEEMLKVAYGIGTLETVTYNNEGEILTRIVTDDVKHRRLIVDTLDKARARMTRKEISAPKREYEFEGDYEAVYE